MKRRHKIIIAVLAVLAVAAAVIAGFAVSSNTTAKTTNSIQKQFDEAFKGASYFKEVKVQTYAGTVTTPQTDGNAQADSVAIGLVVTSLTANDFTDILKRLPATDITTFYQIGLGVDDGYIGVYGFNNKQITNKVITDKIVTALKERETTKTDYLQLSPADVTGEKTEDVTATFTIKEKAVAPTRAIVDKFVAKGTDVIAVNLTVPDGSSYVQTAAVYGELDNFDNLVNFSLQFADATFTPTNQISVIGLGKDIKIAFGTLDEGVTYDSLKKTADDINTGGNYGLTITVNKPEATE